MSRENFFLPHEESHYYQQQLLNVMPKQRRVEATSQNYQCKKCPKVYSTAFNRNRHMITCGRKKKEIKENNFVCQNCYVTFVNRGNLNKHLSRFHMNNNNVANESLVASFENNCEQCIQLITNIVKLDELLPEEIITIKLRIETLAETGYELINENIPKSVELKTKLKQLIDSWFTLLGSVSVSYVPESGKDVSSPHQSEISTTSFDHSSDNASSSYESECITDHQIDDGFVISYPNYVVQPYNSECTSDVSPTHTSECFKLYWPESVASIDDLGCPSDVSDTAECAITFDGFGDGIVPFEQKVSTVEDTVTKLIDDSIHIGSVFNCDHQGCEKLFKSKVTLKQHEQSHKGTIFKCTYEACEKVYTTSGALKQHEQSHKGIVFKCTYEACEKVYTTSGALKLHEKATHMGTIFKCNYEACEKVYKNLCSLKIHEKSTHLGTIFKCNYGACKRVYKSSHALKLHEKAIHMNKSYGHIGTSIKCNWLGCRRTFLTTKGLRQHYDAIHCGITFNCDWASCEKTFNSITGLKAHKETVHEGRIFECDWPLCQSKYSSRQSLVRHVNYFHKHITFDCDWTGCTSKFTTQFLLKQHGFYHLRDEEFSISQPDEFDYTILERAVAEELKELNKVVKSLRDFGLTLKLPRKVHHVVNGKIKNRKRRKRDTVLAKLAWIPRKDEHKEVGKNEGHFITTSRQSIVPWLRQQLKLCAQPNKKSCTHLKKDLYNGVRFDYAKMKIVALATSPWLILNVKFTANHYKPSSNLIKKRPAFLTEWDGETLNEFLSDDALPCSRHTDF